MASLELLYLTQQEVLDVGITLADAIDIVEGALREHGAGQVENPPKPGVHPLPGAFIHAMPAFLKRPGQVGLKWVSGFFDNPRRGIPSISGLIVLNDAQTGLPIAVMDCAYITALRTAAASGVAARHLARKGSAVVAIVGAGLQGRYNLLTLREVLPDLREARAFDIHAETLERFVSDMSGMLPFAVVPAGDAEQAMRGADLVVTATGVVDKPIFKADWVQPGTLVLPIHSQGWEARLLHEADKFVVDDWAQFSGSMTGPGGFYDELPQPYAELGEIVVGRKPGRQSPDERIVDFNYGLAIHDVAMASEVLARAERMGLGTRLAQMDGTLPFA